MSASKGEKILVTVLFVIIGLPPGLCSLYGMSGFMLQGPLGSQGVEYALVFVVPSLVGFAIFGLMLWWLIKTWRRDTP